MAETFGAALKRYHAAGYRAGDAMRAVWHDVKIGRVARPRRRGVVARAKAAKYPVLGRGLRARGNPLGALMGHAPPTITARAAGKLVRSDPAVRRLPRVGWCVRLSDGRELCHDARGYYLVGAARNRGRRNPLGDELVVLGLLAGANPDKPPVGDRRFDHIVEAIGRDHPEWGFARVTAEAMRARVHLGPYAGVNPRGRRNQGRPLVRECAWHPKYFGRRHVELLVAVPPGLSRQAFIAEAGRQGAVTHGVCKQCKPRLEAEIPRRNPWATYAGGTSAHHGYSYDHKSDAGEYHIWPPQTRSGSYHLLWANTRGKAAPHGGLWHDLGRFRSPQAAKGAAKAHALERGVRLNPPIYAHRSAARWLAGLPRGARLTKLNPGAPEQLARAASAIAQRAALEYLQRHQLTAEPAALEATLRSWVKAKLPEAMADAKAALDANMAKVAEQTFGATMALAGIEAAKEAGFPRRNPRGRSRRSFRNAVAGLEAFDLRDRRGWEQAIRDVGGLKVSKQDRADFAEVPGYLKGYRKGVGPDELAQMVAGERGLEAGQVERSMLAAFHAPRRRRASSLEDYERLEREAIQSEGAPRARAHRRGGESRPRVGVGADTFHLRPRSPFKGAIRYVNPTDRYVDLLRQGFMRRALGGPRARRAPVPIVRCERCRDWHPRGRHVQRNPARAQLSRFYDGITEIRGVKGPRFGYRRGTRFYHPFTTRPTARGVDRSGYAYLKRGQVVLGGRRPIYAQLGAA